MRIIKLGGGLDLKSLKLLGGRLRRLDSMITKLVGGGLDFKIAYLVGGGLHLMIAKLVGGDVRISVTFPKLEKRTVLPPNYIVCHCRENTVQRCSAVWAQVRRNCDSHPLQLHSSWRRYVRRRLCVAEQCINTR